MQLLCIDAGPLLLRPGDGLRQAGFEAQSAHLPLFHVHNQTVQVGALIGRATFLKNYGLGPRGNTEGSQGQGDDRSVRFRRRPNLG